MTAPLPPSELICGPFGAANGAWTLDLWITLPLAASLALYGAGLTRLWRRAGAGRGISPRRAACYGAGWLTLLLALVSPIHHWGRELFTIHMIEHELVMAVAAPLLVLARPGAALTWALPRPFRLRVAAGLRRSGLRALWGAATRPGAATVLHGIAIWAWHVPLLFEAARANVALHRLQHISFLLTGLLFWWALVRRRNPGLASAHLFATMLHSSILGALIALAPRVLYPLQTLDAIQWGLMPLQDQQLAGLIMWIPAGAIYAVAALAFFASWIRRAGQGTPVIGLETGVAAP
ncbi:MAG: cytochrome c oxidase assembly protein [Alphaproteobacteria bacterium]|nr:cytochrome c oxidase assembly protein [Alphaproteobacteria bacterium]